MLAKCYRNSKVNVVVSLLETLNCRVRDSDSGILKALLIRLCIRIHFSQQDIISNNCNQNS